jgi:hypothetical protein
MNGKSRTELIEHPDMIKIISNRNLTSECLSIQFWDLPYCKKCEYLATEECGDYTIRKKIFSGRYPKSGLPDQSDGLPFIK